MTDDQAERLINVLERLALIGQEYLSRPVPLKMSGPMDSLGRPTEYTELHASGYVRQADRPVSWYEQRATNT